jgi:hypothetical protein
MEQLPEQKNKARARDPLGIYKEGDTRTSVHKNGFVLKFYMNQGEWCRIKENILAEIEFKELSREAKRENEKIIKDHIHFLILWSRRVHKEFKRAYKVSAKRIRTENKHFFGRRRIYAPRTNVGKHINTERVEGRVRMSKVTLFLIERVISEYPKAKGIIKDYLLTKKPISHIARDNETSEDVVTAICKIITPKLEDFETEIGSGTLDKS